MPAFGNFLYQELLNWFTVQQTEHHMRVRTIALNDVRHWQRTEDEIRHAFGHFFSVIACRIEAGSREVASWTQPLVQGAARGMIAFVVREIDGVLHVLVQAKPEAGCLHRVELAPTVLCMPERYRDAARETWPPFLAEVLAAHPSQIRYDVGQSEEGGRFFHEENRNLVVEFGDELPLQLPGHFIWMTVRQLKEFIRHNHCVNVQARCLLSAMGGW